MKTRRKSKGKNKDDKKAKRSVAQIETKLRVDEATGHLKNKNYNKALSLYHKAKSRRRWRCKMGGGLLTVAKDNQPPSQGVDTNTLKKN
ncbi:hypothetical protein PV325_005415 [Microctonus aethiopoides]|nr:hypothetical protein PV325_005415 [Microctonus aethiopoides]KAK0094467.1 hypothetical protein PV326_010792 [Microctonus aethiopoides]